MKILFLKLWAAMSLLLLSFPTAFAKDTLQKSPSSLQFPPLSPQYQLLPSFQVNIPQDMQQPLNDLIQQSPSPQPPSMIEISPSSKSPDKLYAEGVGTRGGGSGIATWRNSQLFSVEVLDVYRSHNRQHFAKFLEPDANLENWPVSGQTEAAIEEASEQILAEVLQRLSPQLPALTQSLRRVLKDFHFSKWIPLSIELQLLEDYIGDVYLGSDQKHIQIALRRGEQIIYNQAYYKKLNAFNRAALKLHEALYIMNKSRSSAYAQRLVSLFLSRELLQPSFVQKHVLLLLVLGSAVPDINIKNILDLSTSAREVLELPHTPNQVCGLFAGLQVDPNTQTLKLTVKYNAQRPHFSQDDTQSGTGKKIVASFEILQSMKNQKTFFFQGAEMLHFMAPFYYLKYTLSERAPIYRYPAQSIPQDVICFDSQTNKITALQASIRYHEKNSELEQKAARLEIEYLQALSDYQNFRQRYQALSTAQKKILDKSQPNKLLKELDDSIRYYQEIYAARLKADGMDIGYFQAVSDYEILLRRYKNLSAAQKKKLGWNIEAENVDFKKIQKLEADLLSNKIHSLYNSSDTLFLMLEAKDLTRMTLLL